MSRFLEPGIELGDWDLIDGPNGEEWVPHGSQPSDIEILETVHDKYGANLSASGYMDQTEYSIFDTCQEAVEFLCEEILQMEDVEDVIDAATGDPMPKDIQDAKSVAGGVVVRSPHSPTTLLVLHRPGGGDVDPDDALSAAKKYLRKRQLDESGLEAEELPSHDWCKRPEMRSPTQRSQDELLAAAHRPWHSPRRNASRAQSNMPRAERDDFKQFCRQATDRQLYGIYEKESAYPDDDYRVECADICLDEIERRGLERPNGSRARRNRKMSFREKSHLPDSAFLYVGSDGYRKLPFKDAQGRVSCSHLRNALARLGRSKIPEREKASIRRHAENLLDRHCGR